MSSARSAALPLITLLMVLSASGDWVDYPSPGISSDIPAESCDPRSPDANAACRDVCHYGGCRKGGQCQESIFGTARCCHCNC